MTDGRRFDPPGDMTDFDHIPGQREQWSAAVSGWFDEIITYEEQHALVPGERCQYFNWAEDDTPGGLVQPITWGALPNTLLRRFGRRKALELADGLLPIGERADGAGAYFTGPAWEGVSYRPQDEYCEWRVFRDASGKVERIVFTSEPPEYWQALHGDVLPGSAPGSPARYPFAGDKDLLLHLYHEHVDKRVEADDLVAEADMVDTRTGDVIVRAGDYNPWNRWNTADGLMHLCHPANTLTAEIVLGADATVLRERSGRPVDDPDALICYAGYGGPMRNSDPTIGSSVNNLARIGCRVTLRNPVGLYMNHIDLTGITRPDGSPIDERYFRVERGQGDELIEHAVFEVPGDDQVAGRPALTVGDLLIAGEPIVHGGQVAERITVALFGLAHADVAPNTPMGAAAKAAQGVDNPKFLRLLDPDDDIPDGMRAAFDYPGPPGARRADEPSALAASAGAPPNRHRR
jgi:hypothetical protein